MLKPHSSNSTLGRIASGRRFAFILAALLLAGLLAAAPGRSATAASAGAVAITPQRLVQALASTPLAAGELPSGFSEAGDPQDVSGEVQGLVQGLTGAIELPLTGGSSGVVVLGYAVFDTADDASAAFNTNLSLIPGLTIMSSSTPAGFDSPAMLTNGSITFGGFGGIGASACTVLVDNVIVSGISVQLGNPQGGSADDACAVAQGGITHLVAITAGS